MFRGVDIFDWHQGKMSSRRLLILLEHLPEDSAFKTAYRDGDWPLQSQLATGALNELKAMRSDLYALIGKDHFPFKPILSPGAQQAMAAKTAEIRRSHDDVMAQLRGENR